MTLDFCKFKRTVLIKTTYSYGMLYEAFVEEVSPSGRVKFQWTHKTSNWYDADDYKLVEQLLDSAPTKE